LIVRLLMDQMKRLGDKKEEYKVDPRKAVEITVRTLLDVMVDEKGMNIPAERMDSLAVQLADDYEFLTQLEDFMESYLEDYGENYELYDLFD
jgi:hypothetical protein